MSKKATNFFVPVALGAGLVGLGFMAAQRRVSEVGVGIAQDTQGRVVYTVCTVNEKGSLDCDPTATFDLDKACDQVKKYHRRNKNVLVAVSVTAGTESEGNSLSACLNDAGIEHQIDVVSQT